MRQLVLTAILLITFALATVFTVVAQSHSFAPLERRNFTAPAVTGWLEYRPSYPRESQATVNARMRSAMRQAVFLYLKVSSPQPLWCMNSSDFQFNLRNSSGASMPLASQENLSYAVMPEIPVGQIGTGCPYRWVMRKDAEVAVYIDEIYPLLDPGTYTLTITLAPRTHFVPPTTLPVVSFEITP